MKAAPAIGFRCRSSRILLVLSCSVAVLAIVAVWISAGPLWLHLLLSLCTIGYAGTAVSATLHPRVASMVWREQGGVDLTLGDRDDQCEAQGVISAARVLGPLIVLTIRWPPRERAHLWILPDNLDADTRRRLRVRLGAGGIDSLASGNADNA